MADIPTMYKDSDWTKVKGVSGYKIGQDHPKVITKDDNVTRPNDDGNFTCAMTWPGVGNDQQMGACNVIYEFSDGLETNSK